MIYHTVILLIIGFRILPKSPFPYIDEVEALFIVLLLTWVAKHYLTRRIMRFDKLELYILIILLLPFYSAFRALNVFDQPILYGVLTQRAIWISACALVIYKSFQIEQLNNEDIKRSLLILSWLCMSIYFLIFIFVDPSEFSDYKRFVVGGDKNYYKFSLESIPITFGFLYYFCSNKFRLSLSNILLSLPFLLCILIVLQKRSLILAIFCGLSILFLRIISINKLIKIAVIFSVSLTIFIGFSLVYNIDYFIEYIDHFNSAISIVYTGIDGEDDSSNARIFETLLAMPYIEDNLFLGNGDLSTQWNDGYKGVIGYFYPSDIGFLGGVFVYGMYGITILYIQFYIVFKLIIKKTRALYLSNLSIAITGSLLVLFFQSLFKGSIIFSPAPSLILLIILIFSIKNNSEKYRI